MNRLLVPIDFSDGSLHALDYAMKLASELSASVHVLNTYLMPIVGLPEGAVVPTAELAARLHDTAIQQMKKVKARYEGSGIALTSEIQQGDPRETILAVAKEIGADMIVMGTHGRSGLARLLIGSITETVVRTSPVPVVTVRRADEQEKAS